MVDQVKRGRRSTLDITYEILSRCDNGGTNKTSIMHQCNLSYAMLQRYLSGLTLLHLITMNQGGQFQTTSKGERMLEQMKALTDFLRDLRYAVHTTAEVTPM